MNFDLGRLITDCWREYLKIEGRE